MDEPSPARLYATLLGGALLALGVAGFFYSASFGSPGEVGDAFGLFAVNGWLNVLRFLTGALGLFMAGWASRSYALWTGALYLAIAVWGFALGSGESILGFLPVDGADNFLRLAIGALGIGAALTTPAAKASDPATA